MAVRLFSSLHHGSGERITDSEYAWQFRRLATHKSERYTRWLQPGSMFMKISNLQREILAESETQVDDEKVEKQRETLRFCRV